eukprot:9049490-Alexandrium_andersonii.AAC.1
MIPDQAISDTMKALAEARAKAERITRHLQGVQEQQRAAVDEVERLTTELKEMKLAAKQPAESSSSSQGASHAA